MKPEHFKPFNVEHAKAGAPFSTAGGEAVEVFKWDRKHLLCIIGEIKNGGLDVCGWRADGVNKSMSDDRTLVMTPLGYIDGNPVFVGDELIDPSGATFAPGPRDTGHLAGCRWPEPEKKYPVTQMSAGELVTIYKGACWQPLRAIANAALRHAIDNGYAATKEAYDQCSRDLGKAERLLEALGYRSAGNGEWEARDCAARDMAIAEAVRDACALKTNGAWANLGGSVAACAVWKRIQEEIDLAAIIATVPA